MAWIESHQSLSKHIKTLDVAEMLSIGRHQVIGHLMELWWWGLDNIPSSGFMGNVSNTRIAIAACWDGNADEFANALIVAGFIDERPDGRWLHDWYDYAGKLLVKREKDADRKRKSRENPTDVQRTYNGQIADIQRTSERTVPNRTVPNQTKEREIAVQQITKAYEETFGPLRGEPSQLMTLLDYMDKGMELELITTAIHKSSNAEVPLKYADKILANQLRKGIKTVKEAMEESAGGVEVELSVHRKGNPSTRRSDDNPKKSITGGQIGWIAPRESS